MSRTLLPVQIVVLMLSGTGCAKPAYDDGKVIDGDAGPTPEGPRQDADAGVGQLGAPPGPAKPVPADGGKDAGEPGVPPGSGAATQSACIVGVSRIGDCKLP